MSAQEINDEEGWGWDALGEDEPADLHTPESLIHSEKITTFAKSNSDKSLQGRKNSAASATLSGITSSPSFQELEKAIGATLALNFAGANGEESMEQKTLSPSNSFSASKLSSTNLTQQKVMQQRMRQLHNNQRNFNHYYRHLPVSNSMPAKIELAPYLNESESRALILFHSPSLTTNSIRDACSKYGVLYYIRPEFHSRGVTFISYFDLQAATSAKETIMTALGPEAEVSAHYSIMLHATNSNTEEFRLVVKNLPNGGSESDVQSIFSRYGQLRSIQKTFGSGIDLSSAPQNVSIAYSIEYFNIQDARLAASELSATSASIWGPDVSVKFAPLDERKQQLCRQLLATLSRWRSEIAGAPPVPISSIGHSVPPSLPIPGFPPLVPLMNQIPPANLFPVNTPMVDPSMVPTLTGVPFFQPNLFHQQGMIRSSYLPYPATFQAKYDGYNMNYPGENAQNAGFFNKISVDGYDATFNTDTSSNRIVSNIKVESSQRYSEQIQSYSDASSYGESLNHSNVQKNNRKNGKISNGNDRTDLDFVLDLEKILSGLEKRTTVMVRNIPNKYSQQMLLEEVNLKHGGTYDFFYLPIDFKNRCNVGYCFINFLDAKFIPGFVEDFNGQRWKSFNSEKVCAITFARIQGKSAMISRFQNSSLLEKDDEYKPLLFYSHGPEAGKPEPFPASVSRIHRGVNGSVSNAEGHDTLQP